MGTKQTKFSTRFWLAATAGCLAMVMVFAQPALAQVGPDEITDVELADDAVDTAAIQDGAVTMDKLDPAVSGQINQNTTDIGVNAAAIGANTTAIGANAADIATNTTAIVDHETRITNNRTHIGVNALRISVNTDNIGRNATDIATNATDIATNVADIGINAAGITNNVVNIGRNAQRIDENSEGVAMAIAMGGTYLPQPGETFRISGNWGNFEGSNALAFSAALSLSQGAYLTAGAGFGLEEETFGSRAGLSVGW